MFKTLQKYLSDSSITLEAVLNNEEDWLDRFDLKENIKAINNMVRALNSGCIPYICDTYNELSPEHRKLIYDICILEAEKDDDCCCKLQINTMFKH